MIIVDMGEIAVSDEPGGVIATYGLGSCVAVVIHHPPSKSGGMVHCVLWDSRCNLDKAKQMPGFFADTGIPALLRRLAPLAGEPPVEEYMVAVVGGADVPDPDDTFMIGYRNILAVRQALERCGLAVAASDVGGAISRAVRLAVGSGEVVVSSPGMEEWTL